MIYISNIYNHILEGTPTNQVLLNNCNSCIIIKSSKYYIQGGTPTNQVLLNSCNSKISNDFFK
jgi:hypothetical protein